MNELEEIIEEYVGILRDKSTEQMKIDAKQAIEAYISKHYIKKEDVLEAVGEDEDVLSIVQHYANNLRAEIKEKLNIGDRR